MLTSPGADDNRAASWQGKCAPRMSDVPCPPWCQAVGNGPKRPVMLVTEPLGFPAKSPGITPIITPKRGQPWSMGDGKREERDRGASPALAWWEGEPGADTVPAPKECSAAMYPFTKIIPALGYRPNHRRIAAKKASQ